MKIRSHGDLCYEKVISFKDSPQVKLSKLSIF